MRLRPLADRPLPRYPSRARPSGPWRRARRLVRAAALSVAVAAAGCGAASRALDDGPDAGPDAHVPEPPEDGGPTDGDVEAPPDDGGLPPLDFESCEPVYRLSGFMMPPTHSFACGEAPPADPTVEPMPVFIGMGTFCEEGMTWGAFEVPVAGRGAFAVQSPSGVETELVVVPPHRGAVAVAAESPCVEADLVPGVWLIGLSVSERGPEEYDGFEFYFDYVGEG